MTDLENRRRAVSRLLAGSLLAGCILEDESLTADLADDAARTLLDWGVARAQGISQEKPDSKLADLRRTMKRINKEAGKAAPEAQVERVRALLAEIETKQTLEVDNDA